jgi:hypothetical protein
MSRCADAFMQSTASPEERLGGRDLNPKNHFLSSSYQSEDSVAKTARMEDHVALGIMATFNSAPREHCGRRTSR